MLSKTLRIVLDLVASAIVFIITLIIGAIVAGSIFGADAQGNGNYNGATLFLIGFVVTIVFAVWFYKFLESKSKAAKE